jgi:hypothetical protein
VDSCLQAGEEPCLPLYGAGSLVMSQNLADLHQAVRVENVIMVVIIQEKIVPSFALWAKDG